MHLFVVAACIHTDVFRSYLKSSDPLPESARLIMNSSGCKMTFCEQFWKGLNKMRVLFFVCEAQLTGQPHFGRAIG